MMRWEIKSGAWTPLSISGSSGELLAPPITEALQSCQLQAVSRLVAKIMRIINSR